MFNLKKEHPEDECSLCKLVRSRIGNVVYYRDSSITIIKCAVDGFPLIILNRHSENPNRIELDSIHSLMRNRMSDRKYSAFNHTDETSKGHFCVHLLKK